MTSSNDKSSSWICCKSKCRRWITWRMTMKKKERNKRDEKAAVVVVRRGIIFAGHFVAGVSWFPNDVVSQWPLLLLGVRFNGIRIQDIFTTVLLFGDFSVGVCWIWFMWLGLEESKVTSQHAVLQQLPHCLTNLVTILWVRHSMGFDWSTGFISQTIANIWLVTTSDVMIFAVGVDVTCQTNPKSNRTWIENEGVAMTGLLACGKITIPPTKDKQRLTLMVCEAVQPKVSFWNDRSISHHVDVSMTLNLMHQKALDWKVGKMLLFLRWNHPLEGLGILFHQEWGCCRCQTLRGRPWE